MNKLYTCAIVFLLFSVVGYTYKEDSEILSKVKSGQVKLSCDTGSGTKVIAQNQVVAFENGIWIFTNGYSKTCQILKDESSH